MPRDDLRGRTFTFIRKASPYAYCNACLALRLDMSLNEITTVLTALVEAGECERRRRACYGCGRTLELTVPRDVPPRT